MPGANIRLAAMQVLKSGKKGKAMVQALKSALSPENIRKPLDIKRKCKS